jgi:hypothetical protein
MATENLQYAISELAKHKGLWPQIARECDVSYSWLCKFAKSDIPEPSWQKVERIAKRMRELDPKNANRRSTDKKA